MRWRSKAVVEGLSRKSGASARLLGVRLELLLQRRELGERRIRVGLAVAAVPAVASPLDVFRAQRGIAIRPVAARGALGTFAPRRSLAARRTIALFAAPVTRRPIRARLVLRLVAAVGTSLAPAPRVAGVVRHRRRRGGTGGRCCRLTGISRSGLVGGGGSGRGFGPAMRAALARSTVRARPARVLLAAAGPPDVDEFRCGEVALRGGVVRQRGYHGNVLAVRRRINLL